MDGRYTIGTNNRYALFLGEEDTADPRDIRKLVEVEKAKKALKPVLVNDKDSKTSNKDAQDLGESKSKRTLQSDDKAGNNTSDDNMEKVKNRRNREGKPANEPKPRSGDAPTKPVREVGVPRPARRDTERRDGDGGNRRDTEPRPVRRERREWMDGEVESRQDRRGAAPRPRQVTPNNRRKREFERKSGSDKTGVKSVDKRDGGGAHNWGTHKDDDVVTDNQNTLETASGDEGDGAEKKTNNEAERSNKEPVEEPKVLTLEEYRALCGKRQQPKFNLRRAGEGEDPTQWKGLVEIKKKKDIEGSEEEDELDILEFPQRIGRQKHVLDINITFKDTRSGGRPMRGGARPQDSRERREGFDEKTGYGERKQGRRDGARRPGEDNNAEVTEAAALLRVDDEKAFPSL